MAPPISPKEMARRIPEEIINLRDDRKREMLEKKRAALLNATTKPEQPEQPETEYQILNALQSDLSGSIYVQHIFGDNRELQVTAARMIRSLLSSPKTQPPIEKVVGVPGLIERFVSFLYVKDCSTLLFESAWILTNIASGDSKQTAAVVHAKAIPALMDHLGQGDLKLTEQVIWALSNIAGDWSGYRNDILQMNGMNKLLQAMRDAYNQQDRDQALTIFKNCVWCCSNFCRGQPSPDFQLVKECIPALVWLIQADWDDAIIIDSVWALAYLADGADINIFAICDAGVCGICMELIEKSKPALIAAVIRLIGNIVAADHPGPTEQMIMAGVVSKVRPLINHKKKGVRREACWTFSNISAGNPDQVQALIDSGVMVDLLAILDVDDMDIRRECVWCLTNACTRKDPSQVDYLMRIGIVPPLMRFLEDSCKSPEKVTILEAFVNILETYAELDLADHRNKYAEVMEFAGIVKILENLKLDTNPRVEEMAYTLLVEYFGQNPGEMDPSNFEFGTVNGVLNFGNDYDPDDQVMHE